MSSDRSILRDVATTAGVSLRTASRVLNDDPRVAATTRERVQRVMRDLRYTPDLMARSLRGGTDATIGLVVESIADPFFAGLVEAVEDAGSEQGRSVLVASTHGDQDREFRVLQELLRRRVSGLLVVPTAGDHSWLVGESPPLVLVDRPAPGLDVDVVRIDDQRAAYEAVSHLDRSRAPFHRLRRGLPGRRHLSGTSRRLSPGAGRARAGRPEPSRPRGLPDSLRSRRGDEQAACRPRAAHRGLQRVDTLLARRRPHHASRGADGHRSRRVRRLRHGRRSRPRSHGRRSLRGGGRPGSCGSPAPADRGPELAPATVHVPVALLERGSGELTP